MQFVRTKVFVENCIFYYLYRERDLSILFILHSFLCSTNSVPWVWFCGMQTSPWSTIHAKQLTFLTAAKVFQETGKRRDTPHCKNTRLELLCNNANSRLKRRYNYFWDNLQGNAFLWRLEWSLLRCSNALWNLSVDNNETSLSKNKKFSRNNYSNYRQIFSITIFTISIRNIWIGFL